MNMQSTVLVAEDSPTQAVQFQGLLRNAGFRAVVASDGAMALEMIRSSPPDVVVTDLEMPEMNGLELLAAVHQEYPRIPIVLATAVGSEAIAVEALRKGAASYVPKQYVMTDLVPTLKRLLAVVQADRAGAFLAEHVTFNETHYRLNNSDGLIPPLIAQLQQTVERFGLCDGNGGLRVAMALDEALQNATIHGNLEVSSKLREDDDLAAYSALIAQRRKLSPFKERCTDVRFRVTSDSAEFTIRDEGPGFDPNAIPNPTDPAYLDRPCGRGLWLIHAFMDEVHHNSRGNEITMTLRKKTDS